MGFKNRRWSWSWRGRWDGPPNTSIEGLKGIPHGSCPTQDSNCLIEIFLKLRLCYGCELLEVATNAM